jgi:ankyrin repeat protein
MDLQDIQCKTALHYAIQEHRFETTKLLLHFGADPFLGTLSHKYYPS